MAQHSKNRDARKSVKVEKRADNSAIVVALTFIDTTWRLAVPTIGLLFVGIWLDSIFKTKPTLMFVGLILGVIVSVLLVLMQVSDLKRAKERHES